MVAGSILLLMMCISAKWSTTVSKSTLLSKCEKLAIFMAKLHNSNSVIEYLFAASRSLLLAYAINLVYHSIFDTVHYQLQIYRCQNINEIFLAYLAYAKLVALLVCI